MLICQISDLHIKQPGRLAYGRVDTAKALAHCVANINALDPLPDAVVVSGDLVDSGSVEEYQALRSLLDLLTMPYFMIVGNHDGRSGLREVFHDHAWLRQGGDFVQYGLDLGPIRLLALDTLDPPFGGGRLCEARLAWLREQLAATAGRPTLIMMHHPPFPTGIEHMDAIGLPAEDVAALAAAIKPYDNIERIVCGHLHRAIQVRFAGTLASTCPSPAHQVLLDLRVDGTAAYVLEPPAYQLHQWHPGVGLVSHLVYIDHYDGPHPFFDAADECLSTDFPPPTFKLPSRLSHLGW